ncbi:MAG: glycosyltransferase family 4 protein [Candidatus Tectomicrobia bacterium]|nr:glycosyltransferase family 4 protein [Candidatus Tectomicrobia bacterium]
MKLLVVTSAYPYPGHEFAGIFNERCVAALQEHCEHVEVLTPRPYVPPLLTRLSTVPRWKDYAMQPPHERRQGVSIHRPAYVQLPGFLSAWCMDRGRFWGCRRQAHRRHEQIGFDAIVSFDIRSGALAWRLARDFGIPASGWAFGSDLRVRAGSASAQVVCQALQRLDLVFYQSHELRHLAAQLLHVPSDSLCVDTHIVLPHGIPEPPVLPREDLRHSVRSAWGLGDDQVAAVGIGRMSRDKGLFELMDAISLATAQNPRITGICVGSKPAFDDTATIQRTLQERPNLAEHLKLLPACAPDQVWEYLCAADIFVFPSHNEGMPNALLEAMAMGVPALAFAIPPVQEIEAGSSALAVVPPFDTARFAEELLRLASSQVERVVMGEKGKAQIFERFMLHKNIAKAFVQIEKMVANHHTLR